MGFLDRFRGSTSSISCEEFGRRLAMEIVAGAAAATTALETFRTLPGGGLRDYDRLKGALYMWGARLGMGQVVGHVTHQQEVAMWTGVMRVLRPLIAQELGIAEADVAQQMLADEWNPISEAPTAQAASVILIGVVTRLAVGKPVSNSRLISVINGYSNRLGQWPRDQLARVQLQDPPHGN